MNERRLSIVCFSQTWVSMDGGGMDWQWCLEWNLVLAIGDLLVWLIDGLALENDTWRQTRWSRIIQNKNYANHLNRRRSIWRGYSDTNITRRQNAIPWTVVL